jgi:serine/threonine protein kinase
MSTTSESRTCPKCGGPIPAEAPEGLCPKCLLLGVSMPTEAGKGAPHKGTPPTREEVAASFPHLEILEFIGQGGMGFVFKARQPKLDRLVALKILPQLLAGDPAFAERFIREGRLLARLNHPEIVAVHDFGQADGFFYLLMEFVDGVNLRQAMKVGRFTPAQALAIVPRICEALQFAHNEGILHRDIKPENILLDSKGRVKIADFGIAKLMGEPSSGTNLTEKGSALGTPHYMAPEQLEHPQDVDQRVDIYSLGVVFYEMLTGELPIGRFVPPSEKSTVDPRVDEVVLRTLEKERERRTQTAGEVKTQVESIVSGKSPSDLETVWLQPTPPREIRSRRVKLAVAAGLGLALVFVLGLAGLGWFYMKSRAGSGSDAAASGGPFTKTVVLTWATNRWVGDSKETQVIGVWTGTLLEPGEALLAMVKRPDGALEEAQTLQFVQWQPDGIKTSVALSWFFGKLYTPGFGEDDAETASTQLRERMSDKSMTLTSGEPLEMFTVTNHAGGVLAGYVKYVRFSPPRRELWGLLTAKPQAIVHIRRHTALLMSVDYSVALPPGYSVRATANVGQASTHFKPGSTNTQYGSSWFRPYGARGEYRDYPTRREAERKAFEQQVQELPDRGPIPVVLGKPFEVFALTNQNREVYRGFLELVAPHAGRTDVRKSTRN